MLVVPNEERSEFHAKSSLVLRNQNSARRLVLHSPDEAFDKGDASMFPNRAEPRSDCLASAPAFEGRAPEDAVLGQRFLRFAGLPQKRIVSSYYVRLQLSLESIITGYAGRHYVRS